MINQHLVRIYYVAGTKLDTMYAELNKAVPVFKEFLYPTRKWSELNFSNELELEGKMLIASPC